MILTCRERVRYNWMGFFLGGSVFKISLSPRHFWLLSFRPWGQALETLDPTTHNSISWTAFLGTGQLFYSPHSATSVPVRVEHPSQSGHLASNSTNSVASTHWLVHHGNHFLIFWWMSSHQFVCMGLDGVQGMGSETAGAAPMSGVAQWQQGLSDDHVQAELGSDSSGTQLHAPVVSSFAA